LKKYHPELYQDLGISEIKNYDRDKIIDIYIKDLKKNKSHNEIISLAEQIFPQNKRLILEEADALEKIGDIEKEVAILTNFESKNPNDIDVLLKLSNAFQIKGKFKEELSVLNRILEVDNKNIQANVKKGICLIDLQRYGEAEEILKYTTELSPNHTFAWTFLGESQYRQEKDKDAFNSFLRAKEIDPNDWYSLIRLVKYMLEKEDYKKAEEYSTKLTVLRSKSPLSWILLGETQNKLNKLVEAEASFRKAYDLDNNNEEVLLKLGSFLLNNNNYNEAEIYTSKLVEYSSNTGLYWKLLAIAQLHLDKITEAINNFKKAYELDRNDFYSLGFLGLIYGAQNDYKRQEKYFRKVLILAPLNSLAWGNLGDAQLELKKYNEAKKSYIKSIELDANNSESYLGLIQVYLIIGENSKAILELNNFQKKFQDDIDNINELGNMLKYYHLYEEAIAVFKEVAKRKKYNLLPYQNMTLSYLGLNQIKPALAYFTKSINSEIDKENVESFFTGIYEYLDILLLNSDAMVIKEFLDYALKEFKKRNLMSYIYKAIPNTIFNLLKEYQLIPPPRFELLQQILVDNFSDASEMKIPLKYLDVGIRYLIKKEKNVLLKLTKEERNTFKKFVLLNNNTSKKEYIS
jgi:tetratricopeptide (TPR) repeat protein